MTGPSTRQAKGRSSGLPLNALVPYQINRLSFRMNQRLGKALLKHGMTIATWRIMSALDEHDPATVTQLAKAAMIEQSTLSRALQRLEAKGYVSREFDPNQRHVRRISLTSNGREALEEVRELTWQHVDRILRGFTEVEEHQLRSMLERMQWNVEQTL